MNPSKMSKELNVEKIVKHRQNEKLRHRMMTMALENLQLHVPGKPAKETQIGTLDRASRYAAFLRNVAAAVKKGDHVDLDDIYSKARQEVQQLKDCYADDSDDAQPKPGGENGNRRPKVKKRK